MVIFSFKLYIYRGLMVIGWNYVRFFSGSASAAGWLVSTPECVPWLGLNEKLSSPCISRKASPVISTSYQVGYNPLPLVSHRYQLSFTQHDIRLPTPKLACFRCRYHRYRQGSKLKGARVPVAPWMCCGHSKVLACVPCWHPKKTDIKILILVHFDWFKYDDS